MKAPPNIGLERTRCCAHDLKIYPAPGNLIDVGGHRLHIYCLSEGEPTVVMEAGYLAQFPKSSSYCWWGAAIPQSRQQ